MEKRDPIQEQFERFHESHSEIYAEFRHIALNLLQYGRSHYESKAILKVIRYHRALSEKAKPNCSKSITTIPCDTLASSWRKMTNFGLF